MTELEAEDTDEARARIENIDELISKTVAYQEAMEEQNLPATLSSFLEEVALVADIDTVDPDQDYVLLMTLHSAKGLEFPYVFMVGMEDGIFPSHMTISYGDGSGTGGGAAALLCGNYPCHEGADSYLRPAEDDPRRNAVQ